MTTTTAKRNWHPCYVMDCLGGFWEDPNVVTEGTIAFCQGSLDRMTPAQRVCQGARHRFNGDRWQLVPGNDPV